MNRQNIRSRGLSRWLLAVSMLGGATLTGAQARADYNIAAAEAANHDFVEDAKCNLAEAIDSINNGYVNQGYGLHGCINDARGGKRVMLQGTGAHYQVGGGLPIWATGVEISSRAVQKDYVEGAADQRVITVESGASLTLTGIIVQRIGPYTATVIENQGILTLNQTVVQGGNTSGNGGGIYSNGDLRLTDSTVQNNKAAWNGGGIYSQGAAGLTLVRSTVSNNTAALNGGGVYSSSRFYSQLSTISTNTAGGVGGGIYSTSGNNTYLELFWNTVGYNTAPTSAGVYVDHPQTRTQSSIVAKNVRTDGVTYDDYTGNPHGEAADDTLKQYRSVFGTTIGNTNHPNDIIGNSRILPLAANGGLTKTHAIPTDSTALNAAVGNPDCSGTDQRGKPRPVGSACDIGSYELQ